MKIFFCGQPGFPLYPPCPTYIFVSPPGSSSVSPGKLTKNLSRTAAGYRSNPYPLVQDRKCQHMRNFRPMFRPKVQTIELGKILEIIRTKRLLCVVFYGWTGTHQVPVTMGIIYFGYWWPVLVRDAELNRESSFSS